MIKPTAPDERKFLRTDEPELLRTSTETENQDVDTVMETNEIVSKENTLSFKPRIRK